jgi:hypothetical protein
MRQRVPVLVEIAIAGVMAVIFIDLLMASVLGGMVF